MITFRPEAIRMIQEELAQVRPDKETVLKAIQAGCDQYVIKPASPKAVIKKLQDMVPPVEFEEVRRIIEGSFKAPIGAKFASFDTEPVASASIAQVHYAELFDGSKVAVKVRRPGIERVIASDISVMHTIAGLLDRYVSAARRYRPHEVVSEFERVIKSEQDLTIEGVNLNRFSDIFKDDPHIQIPRVFWDYTTEDVLTMERISGTPIDEVETLKSKGIDIKEVAVRGIGIFFKQVFEHGIFHADLHPGNIFVRDDGVIIYLDFGIIGRLDRDLRKYLASMLFHLVRSDYYRMALVHREMGLIGDDVSLSEFEEALRDISVPIFGKSLEKIDISGLLMKLLQTAKRFNMKLQPNLLLLQKSMVIIEGVGRQLYPDVNMWEVAKPLIFKWMAKEKLSPKMIAERGREKLEEIMETAFDLPVNFNTLLRRTLREDIKIGFVHHRLEEVTNELENAGRRIGGGIVVAALVIGASLVAVFSKEATTFLGLPVLSGAGYLVAAIMGLRLFRRSGRNGR